MSNFCRYIVILSLLSAAYSHASYKEDTKKTVKVFNQISVETKDNEKMFTDDLEIFVEDSIQTSLETEEDAQICTDVSKTFDFNQTFSGINTTEKIISKTKTCQIPNRTNIFEVQHDAFNQCISLHINGSELRTELEKSKETGSMNIVFKENCEKWPLIYKCVEKAKLMIKRCLTLSDDVFFNQTIDIVKALQEFLCFSSNGDRLAKFVVGGGVECVHEQHQGVKSCFNETEYPGFPQTGDFLTTTLSMLLYTSRDCKDFDKTSYCVHKVLEKCPNTTTSRVVDASFRFVNLQISCEYDLGLSEKVWYLIVLYVIIMYIYIHLLIQQSFEVNILESPPRV